VHVKTLPILILTVLAFSAFPGRASAQRLLPVGVQVDAPPASALVSRDGAMLGSAVSMSRPEHVAWGAAFGAIVGGVLGALLHQGDHTGEGLNATVMVGAGALLGAGFGAIVGLMLPTS
jgi:hypothetical protein